MNHMASVQLSVDADGQGKTPHCCLHDLGIGCCRGKIAPETHEYLRAAGDHRLQRINDRMTMMLGWPEAEGLLDLAKKLSARFFVNADRPVALHIRMTA